MTTVTLPSPEALAAASSVFTFALVGISAVVAGSAVAAALWARSLNAWALGGVSFVLSQTAQVATLFLLGPLVGAFVNAPLQEFSRTLILATAARRVRGEPAGAAFGLGHGAIDILTSALLPTLSAVVILGGIRDGSIFIGLAPEVTERVNAVGVYLASQGIISAALLIVQVSLMLAVHVMLTLLVLRVVARGGERREIVRGVLLPTAIHLPVAVVRVLFPSVTTPVLLVALVGAVLVYRRGTNAMTETPPTQ